MIRSVALLAFLLERHNNGAELSLSFLCRVSRGPCWRNHYSLPREDDADSPGNETARFSCISDLPSPNEDYSKALIELELDSVITPISDLGYYGWSPSGQIRSNLLSVDGSEIASRVDFSRKPAFLQGVERLKQNLPRTFRNYRKTLKKFDVQNLFPYGRTDIASLYVATQDRGLNLSDVDFMFGSYTLYFLATGELADDGERCIIARVPGTNVLLVTRYQIYTESFAKAGPQFQRWVTGANLDPPFDVDNVVHLHLVSIHNSNILLAGEVDALDADNTPTEVKLGVPLKRANRTLFQMISSSSLQLCRGETLYRGKNDISLEEIKMESLQEVGSRVLHRRRSYAQMKQNIIDRVGWLQNQSQTIFGTVMELSFHNEENGEEADGYATLA